MPITPVATTDTFRTWLQATNTVIDFLNTKVVADAIVAYGVFTIGANANTSLAVSNNFFVNTSLILVKANTTLAANVVVTSNANVFNMAAGSFIIQPINGTVVNSAITVNSTALFLGAITTNAAVTVNGAFTVNGASITNAITANGLILARQTAYTGANSVLAPANLTDPQYNDYGPAGLSDAQVLNLTPALDVVLTGIQAPTTVGVTGARILYVQNLATGFKLTFVNANTSSAANNRFATPQGLSVDVPPGGAVTMIWTTTNRQWRVLVPNILPNDLSLTGNLVVGGTLTVTNTAIFNSNSDFASNTFFIDNANKRVGVRTNAPTVAFHVATGNALFQNVVAAGIVTLSANLVSSANSYLSNNALTLTAPDLNAVFGNTINVNSSSQSYVRSLLTTSLSSNGTSTFGNVSMSGNVSASANVSLTAVTKVSGASGRLVIPVGTGLWAT